MYKDKTIYADEKQEKTLTTPTKNDLKGADVMAYWGCDKRTGDTGNGIGADSMVCNDGKGDFGLEWAFSITEWQKSVSKFAGVSCDELDSVKIF